MVVLFIYLNKWAKIWTATMQQSKTCQPISHILKAEGLEEVGQKLSVYFGGLAKNVVNWRWESQADTIHGCAISALLLLTLLVLLKTIWNACRTCLSCIRQRQTVKKLGPEQQRQRLEILSGNSEKPEPAARPRAASVKVQCSGRCRGSTAAGIRAVQPSHP